ILTVHESQIQRRATQYQPLQPAGFVVCPRIECRRVLPARGTAADSATPPGAAHGFACDQCCGATTDAESTHQQSCFVLSPRPGFGRKAKGSRRAQPGPCPVEIVAGWSAQRK